MIPKFIATSPLVSTLHSKNTLVKISGLNVKGAIPGQISWLFFHLWVEKVIFLRLTTFRDKANFINGRDKKTKWRRVLDDFVSFNMLELQFVFDKKLSSKKIIQIVQKWQRNNNIVLR